MKPRSSRMLRTIKALRELQFEAAQAGVAAAEARRRERAAAVARSRDTRDGWQVEWERNLRLGRFEPAVADNLAHAVRHGAELTLAAERDAARAMGELEAAREVARLSRSRVDLMEAAVGRSLRGELRQRDEAELGRATDRFLALWSRS